MYILRAEFEGAPQIERPKLEDSKDFINVDMNSYGVTTAQRGYTVLKTVGLSSCVGVALYEPTKEIAGLFHLTTPLDVAALGIPIWRSVQEDIVALLVAMQRNGMSFEDRPNMEASLIGDQNSQELRRLMPIVQERLRQLNVSRIAIVEEGERNKTKDIAIDARDGKIYDLINILPIKNNENTFAFQVRGGKPHVTSDNRSLK